MKKLFLTLVITLISVLGFAQEINGVTTGAQIWENEQWTQMPNGEGIPVWINANSTRMTIKSKVQQYYYLYNMSQMHVNSSGHNQITCNATNQNGEEFYMRFVFREDIDGELQIYIHSSYFDVVYDVATFPNE